MLRRLTARGLLQRLETRLSSHVRMSNLGVIEKWVIIRICNNSARDHMLTG